MAVQLDHDLNYDDRAAFYATLADQASALTAGESDAVANAANVASLLFHALPDVIWVGFYLLKTVDGEEQLVVGPFQGKPACVRIPLGRGVCGTSAAERRSVVVDDVHAFPGHITCDADSRSEIVVPVEGADGRLVGVLDIDSATPGRFDDDDRVGLEGVVTRVASALAG